MPDETGIDVDKMAERAERLGLVTPDLQGSEDGDAEEMVVVIHIAGGLVADVGAPRGARLRVIVVDDDVPDDGEGDGVWTETPTALEDWSRDEDAALLRAAGELPESLRRELGLAWPE